MVDLEFFKDVKLLHCCKTVNFELSLRSTIVALLHCCKIANLELFLRSKIVALLQNVKLQIISKM